MALNIGATTAIFSVVDATLLHPLPYPHPEQLVRIEDDLLGTGARDVGMSVPEWKDFERSGIFEYVSAVDVIWRADLSTAGETALGLRKLLQSSPGDYAPQPSPDGSEIVFESARSGKTGIWKCNADGSDPLKLTSLDGHAGTPRWSPDGK